MKCSQSPLVKQQIRNLQILRLATAALTMRAHLTGLLFAVMSCVSMYFHLAIPRLILHNYVHVQSKPAVKAAKEDSFKESVEWLIKYLQ
jgi:hypothetical protein